MFRIRKWFAAPMLVGALITTAAVPASAWGYRSSESKTIAQVLISKSTTNGFDNNSRDYDILIKAAQTADLVGALDDPSANLTLFAPDDAAFIRTANSLGYTGTSEEGAWNFLVGAFTGLGNGNPVPVLRNVLLYHVAATRLGSLQVIFAGRINTLLGESFKVRFVELVDRAPKLPNPYLDVSALNQRASNGVIHGITRVLVPVNIP
jgi:serralysin